MAMKKYFPPELRTPLIALAASVVVAIGLAFLAWFLLGDSFPPPDNRNLRVRYLEQYIAVSQVILVGFFVALVSIIVQFMLPESRDRFERYKESRRAYSRAKTSVLYLPDRVLFSDRKDAFILVEKAHRDLHLAETFKDVITRKGYLDWYENKDLWILYNYWQIVAVAEVLRAGDIDFSNRKELRRALNHAVEVVHKRFGKTGRKCKGENWGLDKRDTGTCYKNRLEEEKRLMKNIRKAIRDSKGK